MKKFRIAVIVILVCLSSVVLLAKPSEQKLQNNKGSGRSGKSNNRSKRGNNYGKRQSNVNTKWERKADTNNDGRIDKSESKAFRQQKSQVDKPWETKADRNNDGVVSSKEAKSYRNNRSQKENQPRPNQQRSENSHNSDAVE